MKRKKICILGTANLKHMTLISLYTEELQKHNLDYDIIYIDKYNEKEEFGKAKLYRYELNLNPNWSFVRKLKHYWGFRKYATNLMKSNKYDFLIIWNEFTAFMFADFISRKYANRYCVNIRDQNFNSNPIVQLRYKQAIDKSCFSTISSERFRELFPKNDYLFIHSYNANLLSGLVPVEKKRDYEKPIRIMFIGRMSYPESIIKTIKSLGNDKRFELWLIGAGCHKFKNIVKDEAYENIIIHDAFNPQKTSEFLANADIIYSLNKEKDIHSDTLLPIKLYYAIAKHVPILTYKTSFTYEYAKKHHIDIGINSIDFDNLGNLIFERYNEMKQADISKGCKNAMNDILNSHVKLREMIKDYIL